MKKIFQTMFLMWVLGALCMPSDASALLGGMWDTYDSLLSKADCEYAGQKSEVKLQRTERVSDKEEREAIRERLEIECKIVLDVLVDEEIIEARFDDEPGEFEVTHSMSPRDPRRFDDHQNKCTNPRHSCAK